MAKEEITYSIIGCAMEVHRDLGPGLREEPYENALVIALEEKGHNVEQQPRIEIQFRGKPVGDCIPDIVVDGKVIVDGKSIDKIGETELAQMLNYLRIAQREVGLILNFKHTKLEVKRVSL